MDALFNLDVGTQGGNFTISQIVASLALTFILAVLIAYVYRHTHKGFSYSQNFIFTLILMSMVTTVIMMVIGNSLAIAFGLLGAFSIVRFRTVVKEAKDTAFIFLALAVGMAVGTGNFMIAITSTVVLLFVIWLLHKFNFGSIHPNDFLLTFEVDTQNNPPDSFVGLFEKYFRSSMLLNINSKNNGSLSEMVYSIRFLDESQSHTLVQDLSGIRGVGSVHLVSSKSDIEY